MEIISRKEAIAQGLSKYFTGQPCKNGHVAERYVHSRECIACRRGQVQRYNGQETMSVERLEKEYEAIVPNHEKTRPLINELKTRHEMDEMALLYAALAIGLRQLLSYAVDPETTAFLENVGKSYRRTEEQ